MKKRDLLIIAAVLAVAVLGMAAMQLLSPPAATDEENQMGRARIYVGQSVYKEVSLDKDQVVEIDQGSGVVNHVEIKDGAIFMADSTCPDQQCVDQGEISLENYESRILRNWVVCLPNTVTIELILEED